MKSVRAVDCFLNGYHANSCLVNLAFHINVKRCFGHASQKCELKIICKCLRMCGLISAVSSCRLHFPTIHLLMALAQQETTKLARLQSALHATTPATGKILKSTCFKSLFLSLSLSLSANLSSCFFYHRKLYPGVGF